MATNPTKIPPDVAKPVNQEEFDADRASRAVDRKKAEPKLRRCLDPVVAAQYEHRKPLYEWSVEATFMRPNTKGRLVERKESRQVVAQNERDAWAIFCDIIESWPGAGSSNRTITKLAKRTIDSDG